MKYRITAGPMLINGIEYDTGDEVELDDARATAWAARVEPVGKAKKAAPEPEPELPADTITDEPDIEHEPIALREIEGDDEPTPVKRKRRGSSDG